MRYNQGNEDGAAMSHETILSVRRPSMIALALVAAVLAVAFGAGPSSARAAEADDEQAAAEWIRKLGDRSYKVREEAQKRLIAIGEPAVGLVTEALKSGDPEVKARAETVLDEIRKISHQARTEAVRKGLLWARPIAGGVTGAPAICDGMAFVVGADQKIHVVGGDQKIHAVDARTGREVWVSGQAGTFSPLRAAGGLVFAVECGNARKLFAYDARKGTVVWSRKVPCSSAVEAAQDFCPPSRGHSPCRRLKDTHGV